MIPKTIHYCWFGPKEKPLMVQNCIQSWEKMLPDYTIICWSESNVDFGHPFLKRAYKDKMYAYVADYIRLKVLYNYGGIYLDTDMLLLKPLDVFLNNEAFIGLESENYISCGIIGAEKHHPYIYECLRFYEKLNTKALDYKKIIIPKIFTQLYRAMYKYSGPIQEAFHENLKVYKKELFYNYPNPRKPEPSNEYLKYITNESYAVHLWHKSWKKKNALHLMREGKIFKSLQLLSIELINERQKIDGKYLRKVASALKKQLV